LENMEVVASFGIFNYVIQMLERFRATKRSSVLEL